VFVAGVHGVGKTTTCEPVARRLRIELITASAIIRAEKADAISSASKEVADVRGNQELLIAGVKRMQGHGGELLIDGHFCVLSSDFVPTPIDVHVFSELNLNAIAVLKDHPKRIQQRLSGRDANIVSVDIIEQLQELEIRTAEIVSVELKVPVRIFETFQPDLVSQFFLDVFRNEVAV
jgi:adenylate kinase